jgi:uncharacterized YccA/Bax inhibitor family protein
MRIRGENPVFKYGNYEQGYDDTYAATYGGVVTKTSYILGIIAITAMYLAYTLNFNALDINIIGPLIIAPIIAIIAVIVTHRNPQIAFISSTVYAIAEGVFIGFFSALIAALYGGELVQMALVGTFGVLAGMLFLYSTGIVRVGPFFKRLMFSMLIGLIISSIVLLILSLAGATIFYNFYILIVLISVVVSSLFLLIDFDRITMYVESNAPKEYEWSMALGLAVTIVWIYIEILRLLVILMGRRR